MKILISPGFGAGWSTWNSGHVAEYMRTYWPIIDSIESGGGITSELIEQLEKECEERFGEKYVCTLGANNLIVKEAIPPFQIHEYDGFESIVYPGEDETWIMEETKVE